jgi:hypothetical protein
MLAGSGKLLSSHPLWLQRWASESNWETVGGSLSHSPPKLCQPTYPQQKDCSCGAHMDGCQWTKLFSVYFQSQINSLLCFCTRLIHFTVDMRQNHKQTFPQKVSTVQKEIKGGCFAVQPRRRQHQATLTSLVAHITQFASSQWSLTGCTAKLECVMIKSAPCQVFQLCSPDQLGPSHCDVAAAGGGAWSSAHQEKEQMWVKQKDVPILPFVTVVTATKPGGVCSSVGMGDTWRHPHSEQLSMGAAQGSMTVGNRTSVGHPNS